MTKSQRDKLKQQRLGQIGSTLYGTPMKIIEYNGTRDVVVLFLDGRGITRHMEYKQFVSGEVRYPYDKSVFGVGYIGEGKYFPGSGSNKNIAYCIWVQMIRRCYVTRERSQDINYKACTVCEEWHNYQNFAQWFYDNYYDVNGEKMCIDKDIIKKGNTIYCPEYCCIVPSRINVLFTKRQNYRGDFPIGVSAHGNKYVASCQKNGGNKYIGLFNSPEEAFFAYKQNKEQYIKEIANQYKKYIPQKLYDALYQYEVEITD